MKNTKNINIEISIECWRVLKHLSIDKDIHMEEVIRNILDKYVSKTKYFNNREEDVK